MRTLTCDICMTAYNDQNIVSVFEVQEFTKISFMGGYGSIFGDGKQIKVDICQHCLKTILQQHLLDGSPLKEYIFDSGKSHQFIEDSTFEVQISEGKDIGGGHTQYDFTLSPSKKEND